MPLRINGETYDIPRIDTLTIEESIVLYDYSKMTIDQVMALEGLHPGVLGGLLHIQIARVKPDMPERQIRDVVGAQRLWDLVEQLNEEADARPPDRSETSDTNALSESSSGVPGGNGSVTLPEQPDPSPTGAQV